MNHPRPRSWKTIDDLDVGPQLRQDIDLLLSAISEDKTDFLSSDWAEDIRQRTHRFLEQGPGAIFHQSALLAALTKERFTTVFGKFCTFLGRPVPIDLDGNTMKEVSDKGAKDSVIAPARGHMTNQELAFHSDRADLTALACWNPSITGGEFKVCSSVRLLEELESLSPKWLPQLRQPIPHDLRDEGSSNSGAGYVLVPILCETSETFVFRYIRKFNDSTSRFGVSISGDTKEMLDTIEKIVNRPGFAIEHQFQRGSIAIVNNHTTLHARNSFSDDEKEKRSLIRYWLSSEFTRALPESFSPIFHRTEPGAHRGGILARKS